MSKKIIDRNTSSFICSCCGEEHSGLGDLAFAAPYYYYTVPEGEREARCSLTPDACSIDDEDFFVRGTLEIPILDSDHEFSFGAWLSVSKANFDHYMSTFRDEISPTDGPYVGWLSVRIPSYSDTLELKIKAHLRGSKTCPRFELDSNDHPLSVAHHEGITLTRLREVYEAYFHAK